MMHRIAAAVFTTLLSASSTVLIVFAGTSTTDNVSSRLMVHIPHSLYKEDGYDHREALFGTPPYGGKIAQNVYYANSELCDANDADPKKGYPRVDGEGWQPPFILMVDRGGCTFVKKVRNAQRNGAAAVLIADNACLCSDDDCRSKNPGMQCENTEPIMADDGSGADISIPSFLMFKHDADDVKKELMANRPVQVEMSWALPNPDNRVEYDLWTVPSDQISAKFLLGFKQVAVALGDHAYFTPHMYIYDGIRSGCMGSDGSNNCYTLCTNNGRYCATDPDNDLDKGISGADVVTESLRRLCIWDRYGSTNGIGEKWWDYIREFNERCNTADYFADDDCIKDAFKHAKIEKETIDSCMRDSGGVTGDKSNQKLDEQIEKQQKYGVVVVPTAFVNTAAIRGALTGANVFQAICAGYAEGTMPKVCTQCLGCADIGACAEKGVCTKGSSSSSNSSISSDGVSKHTFATSMFLVIGLFSALAVWHYKRTREEMRDQVRGILAEYMPLEDQDDHTSNGGMRMGGSIMDFARGGHMNVNSAATSLIS